MFNRPLTSIGPRLVDTFTCPSLLSPANNQITLPHSDFSTPTGAMGTCGAFSAMSVNFTARVEYTSKLTFTATAALNGTVIECTLSTRAFGNDAIKIIGGWYTALY